MPYECRACGGDDLYEVLDMGRMPLAGDFRAKGEVNALYPLAIDGCDSCGLLQVRELVDSRLLFHPGYSYASSSVPGLVQHFNRYAEAVALPPSKRGVRLLEVGCNDGVFLDPLRRVGFEVTGVDASSNVAELAREKGLRVYVDVFGLQAARKIKSTQGVMDVVTCSNVFAHNPLLDDFVAGVREVLDPKLGEFWVEVHSAASLHTNLQWDCFYHEHCFYWTIHALSEYLSSRGLYLKQYETTAMHGGALRAVFTPCGPAVKPVEAKLGRAQWLEFRERCVRSRLLIRECIETLPITYAFGAAGRAVTLINWTGVSDRLRFVVDGSPLRYGKIVPNTSVPVLSEHDFMRKQDVSDWCFVTAHNYLSGIAAKVKKWFPGRSLKFVTPLPNVTIH